ncbi:uncharacterized protein LOC100368136 [Saccoglossus kowalevskii]
MPVHGRPSFTGVFHTSPDGYLFCEDLQVKTVQDEFAKASEYGSPFFMYSKRQIGDNVRSYVEALQRHDLPYILGYAVKANNNLTILRILRDLGCTAVLVSGNELKLAMLAGFSTDKLVFNGNGKTQWEIELAVTHDVMINADSLFDIDHISSVARQLGKKVKMLLRMNPDIDPEVHRYLATGSAVSKFGIPETDLDTALGKAGSDDNIDLVGLHCHIGSTITNIDVFRATVSAMLRYNNHVQGRGFRLKYLNVGGGLGINYRKYIQVCMCIPSGGELIDSIADKIKESGLCLILEPGRSIIASAGILVSKVIGIKRNETRSFLVIDGSMTEVMRPCLYGAYHHIQLIEPTSGTRRYSVVGPVCECGDYLAEDIELPIPHEGCGLAIRDAGAYCASMSSNYNMRVRTI